MPYYSTPTLIVSMNGSKQHTQLNPNAISENKINKSNNNIEFQNKDETIPAFLEKNILHDTAKRFFFFKLIVLSNIEHLAKKKLSYASFFTSCLSEEPPALTALVSQVQLLSHFSTSKFFNFGDDNTFKSIVKSVEHLHLNNKIDILWNKNTTETCSGLTLELTKLHKNLTEIISNYLPKTYKEIDLLNYTITVALNTLLVNNTNIASIKEICSFIADNDNFITGINYLNFDKYLNFIDSENEIFERRDLFEYGIQLTNINILIKIFHVKTEQLNKSIKPEGIPYSYEYLRQECIVLVRKVLKSREGIEENQTGLTNNELNKFLAALEVINTPEELIAKSGEIRNHITENDLKEGLIVSLKELLTEIKYYSISLQLEENFRQFKKKFVIFAQKLLNTFLKSLSKYPVQKNDKLIVSAGKLRNLIKEKALSEESKQNLTKILKSLSTLDTTLLDSNYEVVHQFMINFGDDAELYSPDYYKEVIYKLLFIPGKNLEKFKLLFINQSILKELVTKVRLLLQPEINNKLNEIENIESFPFGSFLILLYFNAIDSLSEHRLQKPRSVIENASFSQIGEWLLNIFKTAIINADFEACFHLSLSLTPQLEKYPFSANNSTYHKLIPQKLSSDKLLHLMNNSKNELITLAILNYILIYKLDDNNLRIDHFLVRLVTLYENKLFPEEPFYNFIKKRLNYLMGNPNLSFDFLYELYTKVSIEDLKLDILHTLIAIKLNLTGNELNKCLDLIMAAFKSDKHQQRNNYIRLVHHAIDYIFNYNHPSLINAISKNNIDLMWKHLDSFSNTSFKYQDNLEMVNFETFLNIFGSRLDEGQFVQKILIFQAKIISVSKQIIDYLFGLANICDLIKILNTLGKLYTRGSLSVNLYAHALTLNYKRIYNLDKTLALTQYQSALIDIYKNANTNVRIDIIEALQFGKSANRELAINFLANVVKNLTWIRQSSAIKNAILCLLEANTPELVFTLAMEALMGYNISTTNYFETISQLAGKDENVLEKAYKYLYLSGKYKLSAIVNTLKTLRAYLDFYRIGNKYFHPEYFDLYHIGNQFMFNNSSKFIKSEMSDQESVKYDIDDITSQNTFNHDYWYKTYQSTYQKNLAADWEKGNNIRISDITYLARRARNNLTNKHNLYLKKFFLMNHNEQIEFMKELVTSGVKRGFNLGYWINAVNNAMSTQIKQAKKCTNVTSQRNLIAQIISNYAEFIDVCRELVFHNHFWFEINSVFPIHEKHIRSHNKYYYKTNYKKQVSKYELVYNLLTMWYLIKKISTLNKDDYQSLAIAKLKDKARDLMQTVFQYVPNSIDCSFTLYSIYPQVALFSKHSFIHNDTQIYFNILTEDIKKKIDNKNPKDCFMWQLRSSVFRNILEHHHFQSVYYITLYPVSPHQKDGKYCELEDFYAISFPLLFKSLESDMQGQNKPLYRLPNVIEEFQLLHDPEYFESYVKSAPRSGVYKDLINPITIDDKTEFFKKLWDRYRLLARIEQVCKIMESEIRFTNLS